MFDPSGMYIGVRYEISIYRFFFLTDISAGSESAFFCKSFLSHLFPNIYIAILSLSNYCSILIGSFNSHFNFLFKNQAPQKGSALRKIRKKKILTIYTNMFSFTYFFLLISSFSNDHYFFILKSLQKWFYLVG